MSLDLVALTHSVTAAIVPLMPYLFKAGEKAAEEAGKKVGGETWEWAKGLWAKLRPNVEAKPAALEAAHDVAQTPENEDAQAALRLQLKKLLSEDNALAQEVAQMMRQPAASITVAASGEGAIGIGGDVSGSTIVTGNRNQVQK